MEVQNPFDETIIVNDKLEVKNREEKNLHDDSIGEIETTNSYGQDKTVIGGIPITDLQNLTERLIPERELQCE